MPHVKKKKVVYVIGRLCIGGAERQVVQTALSLNRDRFIPKVYCVSEGGPFRAPLEQQGIEVTVSHSPALRTSLLTIFRRFLALYRYLRREQPDIVHCYLYTPSLYGGFAAKLAGNPVIITSRRGLGHFKDNKPHYQMLENIVNRFADGVLVNSHAVKDDVFKREALASDKVHMIHNGIDTHTFTPVEHADEYLLSKKHELGISETAPVIGMIANFFAYKGYREFLLAASEVLRHFPQARFVCIGEDCGIQPELEQLCRELGIAQSCLFRLGQYQEIPELIRTFDIQVSASHEEGFSNAVLEGMASGKPIIATTVGGNPEAVQHNVTGVLIPPKDPAALSHAILSLLKNPELASTLGRNGRKWVEDHFSLEKMIDKLENLYSTLCDAH